ncbi:DUF192 domain-containing protein [Aquamicrobium ahrensii]
MKAGRWGSAAAAIFLAATMTAAPQSCFARNDDASIEQPMLLPIDTAPLVIVTKSGARAFNIEIADDAVKRSAGLMYRQSMPDDRGMLFIFEEARPVSFWMKNTPMALDLLFIAEDGRIVSILPGEPFSPAIISPGEPARYVLELKAGTAEREGVTEGDLVEHPRMKATGATGGSSSRGG